MRVLVGCEESQAVCIAFRELGHEAFSCDIQDCSGGHPEWHIKGDVLDAIRGGQWDLGIFFPPCTFLSGAGLHWLKKIPERQAQLNEAKKFFLKIWNSSIDKIVIENPVGHMNTNWRKPSQIIEPYYFGDDAKKRTCLWLKNLPRLNGLVEVAKNKQSFMPKPTYIDKNGKNRYFTDSLGWDQKVERSKTFPGIAKAMAEQWGR